MPTPGCNLRISQRIVAQPEFESCSDERLVPATVSLRKRSRRRWTIRSSSIQYECPRVYRCAWSVLGLRFELQALLMSRVTCFVQASDDNRNPKTRGPFVANPQINRVFWGSLWQQNADELWSRCHGQHLAHSARSYRSQSRKLNHCRCGLLRSNLLRGLGNDCP